MNPYVNEEVAWQRMKDLQREMEYSRIVANRTASLLRLVGLFARRAWLLAGLAAQRPPRWRPRIVETFDVDGSSVEPEPWRRTAS